jgi:TonB family protein
MKRACGCIVLITIGVAVLAVPPALPLFRSADERTTIKITSPDQLELTTDAGRTTCRYSRDSDSLRVVAASLGNVQVFTFKATPEGLMAADGTVLYDERHFGSSAKATKIPKDVVFAPRPEYPEAARSRRITGSGVVLLTVDVATGAVVHTSMSQSIGNPLLDNAVLVAFRQWRFKPHTTEPKLRIPITYTMTGASY